MILFCYFALRPTPRLTPDGCVTCDRDSNERGVIWNVPISRVFRSNSIEGRSRGEPEPFFRQGGRLGLGCGAPLRTDRSLSVKDVNSKMVNSESAKPNST